MVDKTRCYKCGGTGILPVSPSPLVTRIPIVCRLCNGTGYFKATFPPVSARRAEPADQEPAN